MRGGIGITDESDIGFLLERARRELLFGPQVSLLAGIRVEIVELESALDRRAEGRATGSGVDELAPLVAQGEAPVHAPGLREDELAHRRRPAASATIASRRMRPRHT